MKKKFMSVMLAATLVVSLVGCGKKNNNNTATDADDTSNKAITAEEYNATIASNAAVYKKYITLPEYTVSDDLSTDTAIPLYSGSVMYFL